MNPQNQENKRIMPKKQSDAWRWWAKSLGEKPSKCDKESDRIALIRTFIFFTYLITNIFICAGVIRHWNNVNYNEIPSIRESRP